VNTTYIFHIGSEKMQGQFSNTTSTLQTKHGSEKTNKEENITFIVHIGNETMKLTNDLSSSDEVIVTQNLESESTIITTNITKTKNTDTKFNPIGRNGDPRMNKALAACTLRLTQNESF